jgi:hypothetical protein
MKRVLLVMSFFLLSCAARAQEPMQFQAYPPERLLSALMGFHGWNIFAMGVIDADADKRLDELVQNNHIPLGSRINLHSPGGSVLGGMKLGKTIRKYLLQTDVGQFDPTDRVRQSKPGECYSACAIAYLGGDYRFLNVGSIYGVHRFFWENHTEHDADLAQVMSAAIVEYIRSMDVSTDLFTLASQASRTEMLTPAREQLEQLNVVNNGLKPTKWTIESVPEGIYLKGERETANGINKFMIVCSANGGPITLYIVFEVGQNAADAMNFNVESLLLDSSQFSLRNHRVVKTVDKGWMNIMYTVDRPMLEAISKTTTVGIALQPTAEAIIYSGFDRMPFADGRKKLPGFLQVCQRH